MRGHRSRSAAIALAAALGAASASGAPPAPFETADPLKAFVAGEYARGSDYFIRGNAEAVLLRCATDLDGDGRPDELLSERSIWGNRTGPFEVFLRTDGGRYRYVGTADYASRLKAACGARIESCRAAEYLARGACTWQPGWPTIR